MQDRVAAAANCNNNTNLLGATATAESAVAGSSVALVCHMKRAVRELQTSDPSISAHVRLRTPAVVLADLPMLASWQRSAYDDHQLTVSTAAAAAGAADVLRLDSSSRQFADEPRVAWELSGSGSGSNRRPDHSSTLLRLSPPRHPQPQPSPAPNNKAGTSSHLTTGGTQQLQVAAELQKYNDELEESIRRLQQTVFAHKPRVGSDGRLSPPPPQPLGLKAASSTTALLSPPATQANSVRWLSTPSPSSASLREEPTYNATYLKPLFRDAAAEAAEAAWL
jgi:hypothetical protein